jgi:hypothetical protein
MAQRVVTRSVARRRDELEATSRRAQMVGTCTKAMVLRFPEARGRN